MFTASTPRLVAGQPVPDFSTTDVSGQAVSLKKIDSRYILLVFFRYAGCPWCNLAIHRLSLEYKTLLDNECQVVAFIQSEKTAVVDNIYMRHAKKPEFPIIADYDRVFYSRYGVNDSIVAAGQSIKQIPNWLHSVRSHGFTQQRVDESLFLVPASFLIDGRTGKLVKSSYGASYYETEAFMDIYQSVFFKEL